jgi:tripartite-type tricarboxylate transporter receptor subunit TctC
MIPARSFVCAALTLAGTACFAQGSAPYPAKPVRVLIGFTAGSELDVVARLVTHEMSEKWGHKMVIENRAGAGGTVAGAVAAKSPADGYTLFFNSVSHTASSALYPQLSYNPIQDFAGVSQATSAPNVLLVGTGTNVKSVKTLIELARAKPGQINFGSAGVGSGTHIAGEMLRLRLGINVSHVPYKGVPEVIADTVTDRIHYSFAPIGNVLPFVAEKRVTALAVTTLARSPSLPDVPTVAEAAGLPGFDWDQWYGLFAPAKTPRPIVEQLSKEMARVLAIPDVKEKLATRGSVAKSSTPAEFDRFVRAETDKVTKVIKEGGIKLE